MVRFKQGVALDLANVSEVIGRRTRMAGGQRIASVTVLPVDLDAEVDVFVNDHAQDVKEFTWAEVCVSENMHHRRLAELYYSNFPQPFPTGVFATEQEAINWLHSIMDPVPVA